MGALKIEDLPHYTYDDYASWEGDWELIDGFAIARNGTISMAPAPMRKHQNLAGKILTQLNIQIENCEQCEALMEEDWKIDEQTVVRPDVLFVCNEENETYVTKTPEIVIEVISKSTAKKDEEYKFSLYEQEKVNYYIIVYPDDLMAKVFRLNQGKYEKIGVYTRETYSFEQLTCDISLYFEKIFSKYRT